MMTLEQQESEALRLENQEFHTVAQGLVQVLASWFTTRGEKPRATLSRISIF